MKESVRGANGLCFLVEKTHIGYWFWRAVVGKDLAVSCMSFARIVELGSGSAES